MAILCHPVQRDKLLLPPRPAPHHHIPPSVESLVGDLFSNLTRDVMSWKSSRADAGRPDVEGRDPWDDHHHNDVDEGLVVEFIEEAISMAISFM